MASRWSVIARSDEDALIEARLDPDEGVFTATDGATSPRTSCAARTRFSSRRRSRPTSTTCAPVIFWRGGPRIQLHPGEPGLLRGMEAANLKTTDEPYGVLMLITGAVAAAALQRRPAC